MSMDKNVEAALAKIAREWKKVKPATGFARLEDDDYVAKIVKMSVGTAKGKSERLQVQTVFKIMDGDNAGKETSRFDGLDSTGMPYFKGLCEVIGCEVPDNILELPDVLEDFVEQCPDLFNIQLKTKGEYQNIYVKGVSEFVDDGGEGEGEEAYEGEEGEEGAEGEEGYEGEEGAEGEEMYDGEEGEGEEVEPDPEPVRRPRRPAPAPARRRPAPAPPARRPAPSKPKGGTAKKPVGKSGGLRRR